MVDSFKTSANPTSTAQVNPVSSLDCSKADTGVWLVKVIFNLFKHDQFK